MIERVIVQFNDGFEMIYTQEITLDETLNLSTGHWKTMIKATGAPITRTTLRKLTLDDGAKLELPR